MEKLAKNVIEIIGFILCTVIFVLNLMFMSLLADVTEKVHRYTIIMQTIIAILMIAIWLYVKKKSMSNKTYNKIKLSAKTKKIIFVVIIILYILMQISWITIRKATPIYDQGNVYYLAERMYKDELDIIINSGYHQYFELYPQQLTLATIYFIIFKIFSSTNVFILQVINAFSNALTIIGLVLISKQLSKDYKVNLIKTVIIAIAFITLPLLSTFVYGDILSLPMCIFSVYFIMKYLQDNKKRYAFISSLFMWIAYMERMNNLIFILAIIVYLFLDLLKTKDRNVKLVLQKILILIIFVIISLVPSTIVKRVMQDKLELEKDRQFPTTGFLYMGMSEEYRGNGWYNNVIADYAWSDVENSKSEYKEGIQNRIQELIKDPIRCIRFYLSKTASMWTENTYASVWYNSSFNFGQKNKTWQEANLDNLLQEIILYLASWQKVVILVIFGKAIIVLLKHRKNLSNELLLLLTIFIGGFLFHTLWEAKSRYIIPYIVILMPFISISTEEFWDETINNIKERRNVRN